MLKRPIGKRIQTARSPTEPVTIDPAATMTRPLMQATMARRNLDAFTVTDTAIDMKLKWEFDRSFTRKERCRRR
jgi:hypothetical protein